MPAYDYRCHSCGLVFEVTRPLGDRDPVACTACGSETRRVFSPVGVVFKGPGFHNTDYRPRPVEKEPSPSGKDSSEKPAQPAAPSETKSAATTTAD